MLSEVLAVIGGCLLFVPYIACKIKGVDMGHPPYGEVHSLIDEAIMAEYRAKHDSYIIEQLEVLRRTADSGLKMAREDLTPPAPGSYPMPKHNHVDVYQHLLDEIKRTAEHIARVAQ